MTKGVFELLRRDEIIMREYLLLKLSENDFHGVQDAASDLRDIEQYNLGWQKGYEAAEKDRLPKEQRTGEEPV